MQDLSDSLVEKILLTTRSFIQTTKDSPIAAFDADGTLWDIDMGESFFHYQIQKKLIPHLPPDPWKHYQELKKNISRPVAYLWLAQISKGQSLKQVRAWANECCKNLQPLPLYQGQKKIIQFFQSQGVKVFVVTASVKWAVEPAAALYGIPPENVLGIKTKIDHEGIITDIQEGPITWREGKVSGLLEATGGRLPFFCSGNTPGDLALLESSTQFRLAIAGSVKDPSLFQEELSLVKIAQEKGWFYHLSA